MMDYQSARQRFGDRIRAGRVEKGITQEKLGELIEKSTEHISYLERGERSPSFEVILDVAQALDLPIASLMSLEESSETALFPGDFVAPVTEALPEPAQETPEATSQRRSDLDRLNTAFAGIHEMQQLADEYGINDILQDNGGKVLQVLILLGLRISPGREGNDAVDTAGNEYELKTVNRLLNKNAGITTHHHLNKDILRKYRTVTAWYIAIYEGVLLKEIYKLSPLELEPLFEVWEQKIEAQGSALNNPKIPMRYVRRGERVYGDALDEAKED